MLNLNSWWSTYCIDNSSFCWVMLTVWCLPKGTDKFLYFVSWFLNTDVSLSLGCRFIGSLSTSVTHVLGFVFHQMICYWFLLAIDWNGRLTQVKLLNIFLLALYFVLAGCSFQKEYYVFSLRTPGKCCLDNLTNVVVYSNYHAYLLYYYDICP